MSLEKRIKRRVTAREHVFFAVVLPGFEDALLKEMKSLGIDKIDSVERGGILFRGRISDCWKLNLMSRSVTRVLMRLFEFRARNFFTIYEKTGRFPWELFLKKGSVPEVRVSSSSSKLYHTGRIQIEAEKGIARAVEEGDFMSGSRDIPQIVHLRIHEDICTVSIDSSGDHLYRRGYKTGTVAASLRETTAASILIEAGIHDFDYIVDPMCGSGTFAVEAAGIITGRPPGADKCFPFEDWPSFSIKAYDHLKKNYSEKITPVFPSWKKITAFDIDPAAVDAARRNAGAAGLKDVVSVSTGDFFAEKIAIPPEKKGLVVINPPYGGRLSLKDRAGFYKKINDTLKQNYKGFAGAVIVPAEDMEKVAGFEFSRKVVFSNGGIRVSVLFMDSITGPVKRLM